MEKIKKMTRRPRKIDKSCKPVILKLSFCGRLLELQKFEDATFYDTSFCH